MARNIEIKARVDRFEEMQRRIEAIRDAGPMVLDQEDVFFSCPNGRLKLRTFAKERGEVICYLRPDEQGPAASDYLIAETKNPKALKEVLSRALGVLGVVRKRRLLYRLGQTRIHLDRVEELGDFLELEVVLAPRQTEGSGVGLATELMKQLEIEDSSLVDCSYIDLMLKRCQPTGVP